MQAGYFPLLAIFKQVLSKKKLLRAKNLYFGYCYRFCFQEEDGNSNGKYSGQIIENNL